MIFESEYWKKDLLKYARRLAKKKLLEDWEERTFCEFEKDIMLGFYIIRKLIEARKLSDSTVAKKIVGKKIPNKGVAVHLLNHHNYLNHFDFQQADQDQFDVPFLCNQLVHSYIFSPYFDEDESKQTSLLAGIHFCSDRYRNETLFDIAIDDLISLFALCGKDYPWDAQATYKPKQKDYTIISK